MNTLPEADGFIARWSRRKALAREGQALPEPTAATAPDLPTPPTAHPSRTALAPEPAAPPADLAPNDAALQTQVQAPPPPTLADTEQLCPESDFTRFVAQGVSPEVKNAALKKLFTDPHFNVMDGLDTYIEDYGRPDPLPPSMLRQMAQAQFLGLFREDDHPAGATPPDAPHPPDPPATPTVTATLALPVPTDEDPDLRLQPHDAAGLAGTAPGTGDEPGRG